MHKKFFLFSISWILFSMSPTISMQDILITPQKKIPENLELKILRKKFKRNKHTIKVQDISGKERLIKELKILIKKKKKCCQCYYGFYIIGSTIVFLGGMVSLAFSIVNIVQKFS